MCLDRVPPLNGGPFRYASVAGLYEAGPRSKTSYRCATGTQSCPGHPNDLHHLTDAPVSLSLC